jgi:hypothetical protein
VWALRRRLEQLPLQLYAQSMAMFDLVWRTFKHAAAYYSQREPKALASDDSPTSAILPTDAFRRQQPRSDYEYCRSDSTAKHGRTIHADSFSDDAKVLRKFLTIQT